ncbi:energy transducer TonB [Kozakia baliensis]|uniref:energy transducer TonB n=1 Tax=Kozakia baliensis TaxID=153496 RepID=UPI0013966F1A|nr:energy transducer TonB [Kozakia baliensis]
MSSERTCSSAPHRVPLAEPSSQRKAFGSFWLIATLVLLMQLLFLGLAGRHPSLVPTAPHTVQMVFEPPPPPPLAPLPDVAAPASAPPVAAPEAERESDVLPALPSFSHIQSPQAVSPRASSQPPTYRRAVPPVNTSRPENSDKSARNNSAPAMAPRIAAPPVPPEKQEKPGCTAPTPTYPASARVMHEQGIAVLALTIAPGGRIQSSSIARSSGYDDLDNAALSIAGHLSCQNTGSQPVQLSLPVNFRLHR